VARQSIAILGATSHIAKGLIFQFLQDGDCRLHLFTRSPDTQNEFLDSIGRASDESCIVHHGYSDFEDHAYDAVLNLTGPGTGRKLQGDYTRYFTITEEYDNLTLRYLRERHPETLYVSFSSGSIYGRGHLEPVDGHSVNCVEVNHVSQEDYHTLVRLNAEAKHRAHTGLNIVDLRVFAYFSRFIDLSDGYFITEIMTSILSGMPFVTDHSDMVRDYLHPKDLYSFVRLCMSQSRINAAFDVCSARPVRKKEVLEHFSSRYGLKIEWRERLHQDSATGMKQMYCSRWDAATVLGYRAEYTSMDTLSHESGFFLGFRS
jgi:nucleoside-diphosphate-sugar epimerase